MSDICDIIKNSKNVEGFAREDMLRYAEKHNLNAGDVLQLVIDSIKEHCEYNFFGCSDEEGRHISFKKEDIEKALDKCGLTCEDICGHGCCAYINKILHSVGEKIYEDIEDYNIKEE